MNNLLSFLFCFVSTVQAVPIIGGFDAPDRKYAFSASIRLNGVHVCGGSILNKYWILTAAHCLQELKFVSYDNKNWESKNMKIHVGSTLRRLEIASYNIVGIKRYPTYLQNPAGGDIALVRVSKQIEFNDHVTSIKLSKWNLDSGDRVTIVGWGHATRTGSYPRKLQVLENSMVMSSIQCKILYGMSDYQFCSVVPVGKGPCFGDSGAPVIVEKGSKYYLAGVHASGYVKTLCAVGQPNFHMTVSKFRWWIDPIILL